MLTTEDRDNALRILLNKNKIATIDQLKAAMGTRGTMTVHRSLKRVGYLVSYSHRGRFYTLPNIPHFDEFGLWTFDSIKFSRYGNLIDTLAALVEQSEAGYQASELELMLQAEVKHPLVQLVRQKRISRTKVDRIFVYMSQESGQRRRQKLMRRQCQARQELGPILDVEILPDELKAGIILFFSLLDEKQRRLYAGLEAAKLGHGGDRQLADLLGMDPHTVAKGRRELFGDLVDRTSVRQEGGGRNPVEKKTRK